MDETTKNLCSWYDPSCALAWLRDELQAFGVWIYDGVLSGLASLLEVIPAPEFLTNVTSYTLSPGITWAAHPFQLDIGLTIIVSAYTARFVLRRIPGIG